MNDRKLLELAAKAANKSGLRISPPFMCGQFIQHFDDGRSCTWTPLIDDGDALRLLVSLKLDVNFYRGFEEVIVQAEGPVDTPAAIGENYEVREAFGGDMQGIVRRAIVRAAAEIGKAMP